ncbi:flagellar protein FlaG [Paenibacillus silvae]|uniref:flagellar protein FlaG n=1 Tax=Paenibacillus silvae TaxID=1325358 RepID=UPI001F0BA289|nr:MULTISPECIES: flagellar protein FlaG [Paenibacillus]
MEHRVQGTSGTTGTLGAHRTVSTRTTSEESAELLIQNNTMARERLNSLSEQEQAMDQLEIATRALQGPEKTFEISVHEETKAIMIKIKNKATGELIREIPKEKLLDVAASLMELSGLIIDRKA